MIKAIAYTTESILTPSGELISRSSQVDAISRFAAEKAIEIIAWFSDDKQEPDLLKRPGIQALLSCGRQCEIVLCARVSALSRSLALLEPFLKELDRRGIGFEAAEAAWDVVTQQCRRRCRSLPVLPKMVQLSEAAGKFRRYRVAKPDRFNFVDIVHPAPPSISPRL